MAPLSNVSAAQLALGALLVLIYVAAWNKLTCTCAEQSDSAARGGGALDRSVVSPKLEVVNPRDQDARQTALTEDRGAAASRTPSAVDLEVMQGGWRSPKQQQRQERQEEANQGGDGSRAQEPASSNQRKAQQQQMREMGRSTTALDTQYKGCLKISPQQLMAPTEKMQDLTHAACAEYCYSQGLGIVVLTGEIQCGCMREVPPDLPEDNSKCPLRCAGSQEELCGGRAWWCNIHEITTPLKEVIAVYVAPAKRTSSLYSTGRFERFYSDKYVYVKQKFNHQLTRSVDNFYEEVCKRQPGKKIFVQIAGAVDFLLTHFPEQSLLVLTGDEVGNWGLLNKHKPVGPHGADGPFETSDRGHVLLPEIILPFFKQYYDVRQWEAWDDGAVRFVPLGSRVEFPDIDPSTHRLASDRTYIYAYMVSLTDGTRRRVHELLKNDTLVPVEKRFIHVAQHWHGAANNEEYVSPTRYGQIMQDTMFVLCPKGHHVEQFRIYEALEAGAIPVLARDNGYLEEHVPPEYIDSPMIILDDWEDVSATLARLAKNKDELDKRQRDMWQWYHDFMTAKAREIEQALEEKASRGTEGFCATYARKNKASGPQDAAD